MKKVISPNEARENLFEIIKSVNENSTPIEINGPTENKSAVIMSVKEYNAIKETLYLLNNGTLDQIHKRMHDKSGFTDISNGINWDKI